ncbi:MAG: hypothetical protein HFI26_08050 [Lachnospiraceae bacterium]|nr:hypothetical protein [Lachnospiraceae bacterium]
MRDAFKYSGFGMESKEGMELAKRHIPGYDGKNTCDKRRRIRQRWRQTTAWK